MFSVWRRSRRYDSQLFDAIGIYIYTLSNDQSNRRSSLIPTIIEYLPSTERRLPFIEVY